MSREVAVIGGGNNEIISRLMYGLGIAMRLQENLYSLCFSAIAQHLLAAF